MKLIQKLTLLGCCTIAGFLYVLIFLRTGNRFVRPTRVLLRPQKSVLRHETQFIATRAQLFPPDPDFREHEIGDCVRNGDSEMKNLSRTCGCPAEATPSPLHHCCRLLMLKLMKDVFTEMIKADIPFLLTGGSVQGWFLNNKLLPNGLDISAGLPYTLWQSQEYNDILKRLASKGYCVWFREPTWMKIWTGVIPVDIRPWSVVDNELYFAGPDNGNPYKVSHILPKQLAVVEGMHVYIPNKPKEYLDRLHADNKQFDMTSEQMFPPEPSFKEKQMGDCVHNGDAGMKNLSSTCGCPPEKNSVNIHSCCRPHLLKLLKEVYSEVVAADIPMILTRGAIIGWYRNEKLIPHDLDIDAGLFYMYWKSPRYLEIVKRLALRGFCVRLKTPTWTKIWSDVIAFDLFAFNVIGNEIYFDGPFEGNPYHFSYILPKRLAVLEGTKVFIPNRPKDYLDRLYGQGNWIKPLN